MDSWGDEIILEWGSEFSIFYLFEELVSTEKRSIGIVL
jgi:hypothetical protein